MREMQYIDDRSLDFALDEAPMLELIDSAYPEEGIPKRISLAFTTSYIIIGRIGDVIRKPDVVFPVSCRGVSRTHACILRRDGRFYVTDLGALYGTLLDDLPLVPNKAYLLEHGKILTLVKDKPIRYRVRLQ